MALDIDNWFHTYSMCREGPSVCFFDERFVVEEAAVTLPS